MYSLFFLVLFIIKTNKMRTTSISNELTRELVINIFRHGRRNEIINYKTQEEDGQMTLKGITETKEKAKLFYTTYLQERKLDPKKDISYYISNSRRTIQTALSRLSVYCNNEQLENVNKSQLVSEFNAVFDEYMYNAFLFGNKTITNYVENNEKYKKLISSIKEALNLINPRLINIINEYHNCKYYDNYPLPEYFKYIYIIDYLNHHNNQNELSNEEKELKRLFNEFNIYKTVLDITNEENNINILFVNRIMINIAKEIELSISNNPLSKQLVMFSGHDFTLSALLRALNINRNNYYYEFNDEINIILLKNQTNQYFIRILYNNSEINLPFCDKKFCKVDEFLKFIKSKFHYSNEEMIDYCEGNTKDLMQKEYKQNIEDL